MAYDRDRDDRFRGRGEEENRWQGNRGEREGGSFGNFGPNRNRGEWEDRERRDGDDRGFFERAGDEVRSWLGSDRDPDRNRDGDVRWQDPAKNQFRGDPVHFRGGGDGRGQTFGDWRSSGGRDDRPERGDRQSSASAFGNQSNDRYGAGGGGGFAGGQGGGAADTWGGSGFGGDFDRGRRFDRIDAGSTGTQGAHPMSSPVGGGYGGFGSFGGSGSSAREAAIVRNAQQQQGGGDHRQQSGGDVGGGQQQQFAGRPDDHHDRHYSEWRQRQIDELDRDYHDYRREHQSKFEQDFGGWRQKRQSQRQLVGRVTEHMAVVGSDGEHVGTVDKVRGDRIILTKNDENAGGMHHSLPCSWIDTVDDKVTVSKTAKEAIDAWTNEDANRALFEREDQGSEGPHMLNRSFSNTYEEKKG